MFFPIWHFYFIHLVSNPPPPYMFSHVRFHCFMPNYGILMFFQLYPIQWLAAFTFVFFVRTARDELTLGSLHENLPRFPERRGKKIIVVAAVNKYITNLPSRSFKRVTYDCLSIIIDVKQVIQRSDYYIKY